MTDGPLKIEISASKNPPQKIRGIGLWMLAFFALCLLVGVIGVLSAFTRQETNEPAHEKDYATSPSKMTIAGDPLDDSQLQWASPTAGNPISFEYVPLGTQVILHLRPAALLTHPEGEKVRAALGPWGEQTIALIEQSTGAQLSEIETLLIALHRVNDRWSYTLRASFATSQGDSGEIAIGGREVFLPASGKGSVLVSCPREIAAELKQQGDMPALLTRDLERLLSHTDRDRTATLLMPGKFLDMEGRELFLKGGEKLVVAFDALVPDNASAVMISLDWHEHFFCELAATIVQNEPAHRFTAKFAERLKAAEKHLATLLESNPPHPYGRALEERLPAMLRTMSDYTRASQAKGIALVRCYLPLQAGHNLLLASRLRLSGASPAIETYEPSISLTERLQQKTSLSFPRETLENALKMLADDVQVPLQIAGRDLQLEGITKNQTFALDRRDQSAEQILVEVLLQANPDRDIKGPDDPRQKLVYVIRNDVVIVTTRSAAAQRSEPLPEVFRVKEP